MEKKVYVELAQGFVLGYLSYTPLGASVKVGEVHDRWRIQFPDTEIMPVVAASLEALIQQGNVLRENSHGSLVTMRIRLNTIARVWPPFSGCVPVGFVFGGLRRASDTPVVQVSDLRTKMSKLWQQTSAVAELYNAVDVLRRRGYISSSARTTDIDQWYISPRVQPID
jgi:hypothetical protein